MQISQLQKEIHENAANHGWWEPQEAAQTFRIREGELFDSEELVFVQRTFGDLIALCHSELSEALEAFRETGKVEAFVDPDTGKPEGAAVELADCIVRILDLAEFYGINMEGIILAKHEYNKSRPFRHGNKAL